MSGTLGVAPSTSSLPPKPIIGAIRWDAYYGPEGGVVQDYSETLLSPEQNQSRAPFFAQAGSAGGLTLPGDQQAVIDEEIKLAASSGINYFAFDYYSPSDPMQTALQLYLNSSYNNEVNFTLIDTLGWGSTLGDYQQVMADRVTMMARSDWQTDAQGNLIYYLLVPDPATLDAWSSQFWNGSVSNMAVALDWLRAQVLQETGKSLDVILMTQDNTDAVQIGEALGINSISDYAVNGGDVPGSAYSTLTAEVEGHWTSETSTGFSVVPTVETGWDPNLPLEDPPPWGGPSDGTTTYAAGSATAIAAQVSDAISWIQANPSRDPANVALLYSWNENLEGGSTLDPSYVPGQPAGNASILTAVGQTLNAAVVSVLPIAGGETETIDATGTDRIYESDGTLVQVINPDGSYDTFAGGTESRYSPLGLLTEKDYADGSVWTLCPDGSSLFFAPNSVGDVVLQKQQFPNGDYIQFVGPGSTNGGPLYSTAGVLIATVAPGSTATLRSDGSITVVGTDGTLQWTLMPNGDTTIPWPDGQLWYGQSGTYLMHEVDGADGSKTFYGPQGNLLQIDHPDGSRSVFLVGGDIQSFDSSGALVSTLLLNGDVTIPWPDGELWYGPNGAYLMHQVDGADGTTTFYGPQGNVQQIDYPDGSTIVYQASGAIRSLNSSGALVSTLMPNGDTTIPWPDGQLWYDSTGAYLMHEVDGADGIETFYSPQGNPLQVDDPGGLAVAASATEASKGAICPGGLVVSLLAAGDASMPWSDGELWYDLTGNYLFHEVDASDGGKSFYGPQGDLQQIDYPDGSEVLLSGSNDVSQGQAGAYAIEESLLSVSNGQAMEFMTGQSPGIFTDMTETVGDLLLVGGSSESTLVAGSTSAIEIAGTGTTNFRFYDGSAGGTYLILNFMPQLDSITLNGYGSSQASAISSVSITAAGYSALHLTDGSTIEVSSATSYTGNILEDVFYH